MFNFWQEPKNKFVLTLALVSVFLFSLPMMAGAAEKTGDTQTVQQPDFEKFNQVYTDILENYAEEVDLEKLEEGAIKGMLETLDPHSRYFTQEEFQDFQESTEGTFGGVGMKIEKVGEYVQVVAPLPDTPAERVNLQPGDKILKVGTEDVKGYSLKEVSDLIKGEPGTSVLLTIGREGESQPLILSITREIIKLDVVDKEMFENKIGYIRLKTFSSYSVSEFKKALAELKAEGAEGLILDLRSNPGGYLIAALSVASTFVDEKDELVHVVSRDETENTYWSTSPALNLPLAVLINGGSASGSEIVAGAIQDHGVGYLVGTQSFGKASVQVVKTLENGAAYKLTRAKYLTPNKRDINEKGLTPDFVVEDPEKQLTKAKEVVESLLNYGKNGSVIDLTVAEKIYSVNGISKEFTAAPYVSDNVVMVPVRFAREFGAEVSWDAETGAINVETGEKRLEIMPGSNKVVVNGRENTLSTAITTQDNTAFIPLRFLAEQFGAQVEWDPQNLQATVSYSK